MDFFNEVTGTGFLRVGDDEREVQYKIVESTSRGRWFAEASLSGHKGFLIAAIWAESAQLTLDDGRTVSAIPLTQGIADTAKFSLNGYF